MADQMRAGIIGCGNISSMHAGNYETSSSARLVAAADVSEAARTAFAGAHPEVKVFASAQEMLEAERLDLVSICTPPAFHLEPALQAASAGIKGLLLEKPMALNLPDADRIIETCRRHAVTLAIGHQLRCAGIYRTARKLVQDGAIGQLERIWGICHGAPIQTNATHTIDLMRYFAGDAVVSWVLGAIDTGTGRRLEGIRQEDAGLGFFQFTDGPTALIEAGRLETFRGYHHIYLEGSEGQIEVSRREGPPIRLRAASTGGQWKEPEKLPDLNPIDDLAEAVRSGGVPLSSGAQGRATLEVILALFESARSHRRNDLPLQVSTNPLDEIYDSSPRSS